MNEINNETKKEITIDELAMMVAKGFNAMDEKFNAVDEKFNAMDEKLNAMDEKLTTIQADMNKKVDRVDYNTLTYRVEKLEKKFA